MARHKVVLMNGEEGVVLFVAGGLRKYFLCFS